MNILSLLTMVLALVVAMIAIGAGRTDLMAFFTAIAFLPPITDIAQNTRRRE